MKHGMSHTRLYRIWADMKTRCLNPNHKWFSHYGGRGINVCDDWTSFEPFMAWALNNGYSDALTLDRIDNDRGYEPSNCRWATQQEQSLNKRHLASKTGFVGVRWRGDANKYQAEVTDHCKYHYVGLFDTPEEASLARSRYIEVNHLHGR